MASSGTPQPPKMSRKRIPRTVEANINFVAGLVSGVVQAGLLNPWDRALYLSVVQHRPFIRCANFKDPYRGFWQSVVHRTLSGGTYFMLQAQMQTLLAHFTSTEPEDGISTNANANPTTTSTNSTGSSTVSSEATHKIHMSPELQHFIVGLGAGMTNGMLLNKLASVKYHAWNQREGISFWAAAKQMYKKGGYPVFFKGIVVTGLRDMTFGCVYEVMRVILRPHFEKMVKQRTQLIKAKSTIEGKNATNHLFPISLYFIANMISASIATVVSGPFNYARSMQYACKADEVTPSIMNVLKTLWQECHQQGSVWRGMSHLQQRLRVGWGTARVGVGMAIGQHVFDWAKSSMDTAFSARYN